MWAVMGFDQSISPSSSFPVLPIGAAGCDQSMSSIVSFLRVTGLDQSSSSSSSSSATLSVRIPFDLGA